MTFKNYLNEIFDNPYEYEIKYSTDNMYAKFTDEEGDPFKVKIDFDPLYQFPELQGQLGPNDSISELWFLKNEDLVADPSNAFRVFATIKQILKDNKSKIKKHSKNGFIFTGKSNESSRVKLYKVLLKHIKKEFGYKYTHVYKEKDSMHDVSNMIFLATNIKVNV